MSYGLRYTITQKLRNETNLVLNIYENGYLGINVTNYDAIKLEIQPNASNDEPLPGIISSQLNISFGISTQYDFDNFPYLLTTDDRKYYVELLNNSNKIWVGFLFNDYVQIPFTTGYLQIDLIAIDGLSFLNSMPFVPAFNESVNTIQSFLTTIANGLNLINFPTQLKLLTSCSYYAENMANRSTNTANEPFYQTYQYKRDFLGHTYYDIIDNIVTSLGCRLFQADGLWQVININETAEDTRYYTTYNIYPTISVSSSGILNKNVTIKPYVLDNVHFINNSQNKLVRKGYNVVQLDGQMQSAENYITNGNFKIFDLTQTQPVSGWEFGHSGSLSYSDFVQLDDESNVIKLGSGAAGSDNAYLELKGGITINDFKPYMIRPNFTISFDCWFGGIQSNLSGLVQISLLGSNNVVYYYNNSNTWQTSQTYYTVNNAAGLFANSYGNYSINVILTYPNVPGTYDYEGQIGIKFYCNSSHQIAEIKNVKITQKVGFPTNLSIINQISDSKSTTKSLSQPYGMNQDNYISKNFSGFLFNSSKVELKNWYRYGKTEQFLTLQNLMAKEYSNLLNKNFGTLESDLGAFQSDVGLLTLDKVYLVEDSSTNPLSYNGKKFIANRLNITPQVNETTSFQIVEVSNTDLSTTQFIIYS
jgi:hypothetical protein